MGLLNIQKNVALWDLFFGIFFKLNYRCCRERFKNPFQTETRISHQFLLQNHAAYNIGKILGR